MNEYERRQLEKVHAWKVQEPSVLNKYLIPASLPFAWLIEKVIPIKVMNAIVQGLNSTGKWATDKSDIMKMSDIEDIGELKNFEMEFLDEMSKEMRKWSIGMATVEGAATGAGGALLLAVDVPAIIVLALRTIYKIGLCYGFEPTTVEDEEFVLMILATSGANTMSEKIAALTLIKGVEKKIAKDLAVQKLANQLTTNMAKRKFLQIVPVVGAVVGGGINGMFMKDVGLAAQRSFQNKWLEQKVSKKKSNS
ncbi:MAG: EcsC family protein [Bacteriovoracaceae bacterium]|nr:EcsC family protein [Bacteriovoracaceae bacterium]